MLVVEAIDFTAATVRSPGSFLDDLWRVAIDSSWAIFAYVFST